MAQQLPGDWQSRTDPNTNQTYYSSALYHRVQWSRPTFAQPPPLPSLPRSPAAGDPPGGNPLSLWRGAMYPLENGEWRRGWCAPDLGCSQWESPTLPGVPPPLDLPDGWGLKLVGDPDCRLYFAHEALNRTQFEPPTHTSVPELPRDGSQGHGYVRPPLSFPPPMSERAPRNWRGALWPVENGQWRRGWVDPVRNASQWDEPRYEDTPPPLREVRPPPASPRPPRPRPQPANDPGHEDDDDDDERGPASKIFCVMHLELFVHVAGATAGALGAKTWRWPPRYTHGGRNPSTSFLRKSTPSSGRVRERRGYRRNTWWQSWSEHMIKKRAVRLVLG